MSTTPPPYPNYVHTQHPDMNFTASTETDLLSLDNIRETLIRLEDTIIFCKSIVASVTSQG